MTPMPTRTERLLTHHPDVTCTYCGHQGIRIVERLELDPVGSSSLAGAQTKTTGRWWPYAICDGCGHTSRGTTG